ncbi:CHAP domain-containing protein [Nonomuraea angiospora]
MSGAAAMLAEARKDLGMSGRPNQITRDYASRNGDEFLRAPWCDQGITHWARQSGNAAAVLPRGDRAYTVWHAEDGQRLGRWYAGTAANIRAHARPGAVIFFDWGGTNNVGAIDHVGLIEVNLQDGRVQTIEANTGDAVKRRVRGPEVIAGFWNPDYQEEDDMTADALYNAAWEQDRMPVPYGSDTNKEWKPRSVLVDHGVKLRQILAAVEAQNATIKALADALAQRDQAVDVDALVGRIRTEIERVTVRLDVPE